MALDLMQTCLGNNMRASYVFNAQTSYTANHYQFSRSLFGLYM